MDAAILPLVISVISLIISVVGVIIGWRLSVLSLRKEARQDHTNMLLQMDCYFIENPELWAIFDSHPLSKTKDMSPLAIAKRESFLFYLFNTYDIVYDFYVNLIKKNKSDENQFISWSNYMIDLFHDSEEARKLFMINKNWYTEKYSNYVMDIINH